MVCEPDMALFQTASGSLARRNTLEDISSKNCKTANTSRQWWPQERTRGL